MVILPALVLLCGVFTADVAPAQSAANSGSSQTVFQEGAEVQRSAREILASPEFRHFRRLSERSARSGSGSGGGGMSGSSGGSAEGGQGGAQGSSENGRSGRRQEANPRSRSNPDEGSGRSAIPPSAAASGAAAAFGSIAFAVTVVLLAGIALLILYLIVRAFMSYDPPKKLADSPVTSADDLDDEPEQAPGELPADVYVACARELADRGEYREALAHLLLGAMSHIERAGLVRYRRGLTHRDYLRAVRPRRPAFQAMRKMVKLYEPLGFGRREAARSHFEDGLASYQAGFRGTVNANTH